MRRLAVLRHDHHRSVHFAVGAILLIGATLISGLPGAAMALASVVIVFDGLVPPPGTTLPEADDHFCRAVRRRRRAHIWRRMCGRRPERLVILDDRVARDRRSLGVLTVRLDSVVGTVEPSKARDFDGRFRPSMPIREHWKRVWVGFAGTSLPPIAVYRVSTALDHGAATIDADVIELRAATRLTAEGDGLSPGRRL